MAHLSEHPSPSGTKWSVVHGDAEDPEFGEIGLLHFSPAVNHLAYPAREGKERIVVLDGQRGPKRGFGGIGDLWWIRGETQLIYEALIGQSWQLVVGDQVIPSAGRSYAFAYENGTLGTVQSKDGAASAFFDTTKVFTCRRGTRLIPWWQEKQFACIDIHEGKQVLVFNGKPGPAVDRVGYPEHPSVSRDGEQVIYGAEDGDKKFVVVRGSRHPFSSLWRPRIWPRWQICLSCLRPQKRISRWGWNSLALIRGRGPSGL